MDLTKLFEVIDSAVGDKVVFRGLSFEIDAGFVCIDFLPDTETYDITFIGKDGRTLNFLAFDNEHLKETIEDFIH